MTQGRKSENAVMTVSLKDSVELVEMKMGAGNEFQKVLRRGSKY